MPKGYAPIAMASHCTPDLPWNRETDPCAGIGFRVRPDAAAVGLDDGAREIQPQPRTFGLLHRAGRAVKAIKDMWQVSCLNAGAFIAYAHDHLFGTNTAADPDLSAGCIFERIRTKI